MATVVETAPSGTRLAGLVLVSSGLGRFAAIVFDGHTVLERCEGALDEPGDAQRLLGLCRGGVPIVSDAPRRAVDLLARAGASAPQVWDVLELASLVAPACPSGGLERAAGFFGIVVDRAGPALQAERALMLFELLLAIVDRLDTQTLLHISRLSVGLDWPLRSLFSEMLQRRSVSPLEAGALAAGTPIGAWITQGAPGRRRGSAVAVSDGEAMPLEPAEVASRLEPNADIARALPGYEPRREQVRMAELVTETLNTGGQLLLEAGTGTGKGLAYLLPAALLAIRNNLRVVVSTATTTLQDQLFEHDLPLVQAGLHGERPLRATVLKGRSNYLCLRRWQTLLHAGDLTPADRMLLIKTLFWLPQTRTGDRAELQLSQAEDEAWQRLNAVAEACTPVRCSYHRIGVCFLARARRAAEESHIVIANHALLLSDLASRSRVLPEYDVLIVDEAHHLEHEATQQLGWRLGERELLNRLERLWNPSGGGSGALPEASGIVLASNSLAVPPGFRPAVEQAEEAALALGATIRHFFGELLRLLDDPEVQALFKATDESAVRVTGGVRAGSAWQELEGVWSEAVEHLQILERVLVAITAEVEGLPGAPDEARELGAELSGHLDYWRDLRRRLQACIHQPDPRAVHWISGGARFRSAWLNAAPLEVASLLRERLFAAPEAVILVSATLAVGGSFEYVKRRLGLEDAQAHTLGSPFDYDRAALLYVPNDLPDPTQPGYQAILERTILDVIGRLRGRSLVLFTSRAHLRATYLAVREPLARQGITLLAQGMDESSRTRLLDAFRRGSRVALFGTNAFWEGIDVVGDALSCVMVTRLPFAVPSDPVYAARAEQFDDPFSQYAVPQAVLRLKQGFGRLIRSRADRGAVVVLDRRLVTRAYGQVFVRSLPACSVKQGPALRAGLEAIEWLTPSATQLQLQVAPG